MAVDELDTVQHLAIADIIVDRRLRPTSEAAVLSLMQGITEAGRFYTRILVRRTKAGDCLIDGAHRLEAVKRLGWTTIPAVVVTCSNELADFLETDANLNRADLTALDLAVFLSSGRRVYQKMHPETKQGTAGAAGRWGKLTNSSLASVIAEARGVTPRHVMRIMAAGDALGPDEIAKLRKAPKPVNMDDLQAISKINQAVLRYDVVDALAEGRAKTAAAAIAAQRSVPPPDPVDAAYMKLCSAWDRAPKVARRRFMESRGADMAKVLPKGGEA
jgi:ParB family chromosome partitioning protein